MNRILCALLCALPLPMAYAADVSGQDRSLAVGEALIGTPAPRLTLTTLDGQQIDLGQYYGKAARLKAEQLARRRDLRMLGIASGLWTNNADLSEYQKANSVQLPLALDAALKKVQGASGG